MKLAAAGKLGLLEWAEELVVDAVSLDTHPDELRIDGLHESGRPTEVVVPTALQAWHLPGYGGPAGR